MAVQPSGRPPLRFADGTHVGTFAALNSPAAVEILGASDFDFVCLDTEHGVSSRSELEHLVRAAEVAGVRPLVRVPRVGADIGAALDVGAHGVVVPRVESADDAQQAVQEARFPPVGRRGAGPGRATGYGSRMSEHLADADQRIQVVVQVETVGGVERVAEIVGVEGFDAVLVGPADLSVSLGARPGSVAHRQAIASVVDAATAAGIPVGIFCATAGEIPGYLSDGFTCFFLGADLTFLAGASRAQLAEARRALGTRRGADDEGSSR